MFPVALIATVNGRAASLGVMLAVATAAERQTLDATHHHAGLELKHMGDTDRAIKGRFITSIAKN